MTKTAADTLDEMAETFRNRNAVYGNNYVRLGNSLHALFPAGLTVNSPEGWTRLYFFMLTQVKLSRYATNFDDGGHPDSVHDAAVYAAMLETYDAHSALAAALSASDNGQMGARDGAQARNAPRRAQAHGGQPPKHGRR